MSKTVHVRGKIYIPETNYVLLLENLVPRRKKTFHNFHKMENFGRPTDQKCGLNSSEFE